MRAIAPCWRNARHHRPEHTATHLPKNYGTNMRCCWSARRKAKAIDKNSSKVRRRED
jgi:hypothetical protein